MDNYENDERHILYDGAERRRTSHIDDALLERLIDTIKNDKESQTKVLQPSIIIPIIFSICAAIFTFIFSLNDKTVKLEYKVGTLEQNQNEIKENLKAINRNLDNIDTSVEQVILQHNQQNHK